MRLHPVSRIRAVPSRRAWSVLVAATLMVPLAAQPSAQAGTTDADRLVPLAGPVDITDTPGTITAQHASPMPEEDVSRAIDNSPYRKYFTRNSGTWIQFTADTAATVAGYTLTSANDAPDRNPRGWTFQASSNGTAWTTLDTRSNETFLVGFEKKTYSVANTAAYRYYRLQVTANNGSPDFQLGEWQILGTTTATTPSPTAPQAPSAAVGGMVRPRSSDHLEIRWVDTTRWETGYELQRLNGSTWTTLAVLPTGTTRYFDLNRSGNTTYQYRVRALGTVASGWLSGSGTTLSATAPATLTETLHDPPSYNETVSLIGTDGSVSAYRTSALAGTDLTWARSYVRAIWDDVRSTYGGLGGQRLYTVFHHGPTNGGTARSLFEESSFYRNMIDTEGSGYTASSFERRNVLAHEIGHVVEFSSYGVFGSPAMDIWKDSKWCEIFQYDAYLGAGFTTDAQDWRNLLNSQSADSFPRPGTRWFENWFLKIYQGYPGSSASGSVVLDRFFQLLAAHFHRFDGAYQRSLNWGEFVHFWSGAAGVNLQPLAAQAFGWPTQWGTELTQAKVDFPGVTYA